MAYRVLYVNGGIMDKGGISTYMMNYFRKIDHSKIHIDFLVHGEGGVYDEEIVAAGSKVYHVPTKRENYIENVKKINSVIKDGRYDIVHAHMDGMNGKILKVAKKNGVPVRMSHRHNTEHLTTNKIKLLYHEFQRKRIPKSATELWARSEKAGEWLYGKERSFTVIPNAIDVGKLAFNKTVRDKLRKEIGVSDKYVVGHVGRFDINQKNQLFLLEVFSEVLMERNDAVLVLIGDGKDRSLIENKAEELNISDKVILLGQKQNVNEWMNIFDIFTLPSRFEGFGIVAIEAQANGLRCVCSDAIPKEVMCMNNFKLLNLNDKKVWIENICEYYERIGNAKMIVQERGYDIYTQTLVLSERYNNLVKNNY